MRYLILYFLFSLFFFNTDSFFLNRIKNSRIYYNNQIKNLSSKKSCSLKKPKYTIFHNKYNIQLQYNNISDYFFENKYLQDKNIINIFPAGLRGFYEMGICIYIKEKYNTDNLIFSGASAGAWNSLLMAYNGNIANFKNFILDIDYENIHSIYDLQLTLKKNILKNFKSSDFDFKKIYIGVTVLEKFRFKNHIFTDFESLDDALNCIIASSNIPFITGKLFFKYRNKFSFDGGFSKDPFIHNPYKNLSIHPDIFKDYDKIHDPSNIIEDEIFDLDFKLLLQLFERGYKDASNHDKFIRQNILNISE